MPIVIYPGNKNNLIKPLEFGIFHQFGMYKINGIGQKSDIEIKDSYSRKENWIPFDVQLFGQLHHHCQQGTVVFRLEQSLYFTWEGGSVRLPVSMQKGLTR